MKILVFAAYLLIAVAMIHTYDHDAEITVRKYFDDCVEELNVSKAYTGPINYCVARKTSTIDENDEIIWSEVGKFFNRVIKDQGAAKCVTQIVEQCGYNAQQAGGTNLEKFRNVTDCAAPALKVILEQD